MAHLVREKGFNAYVMTGGLRAWRKHGFPIERVPSEDLVMLPSFQ